MSNVNWRIKVADKEFFWDTLETYNGYKFQHNKVVGQYRVVSPDKYREAWAFNRDEVYNDFKHISGKNKQQTVSIQQSMPQANTQGTDPLDQLERLYNLYTSGVIEKEEYEELRAKIMKELKG